MALTFRHIEDARARIASHVLKTPLLRLPALDAYLGCRVYAKAECMQITGSFKYRGAMNKILSLSDEELDRGIVAASSGNHGKALAYAAKMLGVKATIVLPYTAAQIKPYRAGAPRSSAATSANGSRWRSVSAGRRGPRWCRPSTTKRSWRARARPVWSSWSRSRPWIWWWSPPAAAGSSAACPRR